MGQSSLCDSRHEDCRYATVHGVNLVDDLMCLVEGFNVSDVTNTQIELREGCSREYWPQEQVYVTLD